jgi:ribosome-interacting GTPase 1
MPANLPPTYFEKEKELKFAQTPEEKIQIYSELLSIMPKHKGTDKLRADIRSRISKLKKEIGKQTGAARVDLYHVPREGAAQVVMLGMPNSGKSQILKALTNAEPDVQNYPYTTQVPQVGMIPYKDIQIQLVDMPPISRDYAPGWIFGIARGADLLLIIIDLKNRDVKEEMKTVIDLLESSHIKIAPISGNIKDENFLTKKGIFVCNKRDMEGTENKFTELKNKYGLNVKFFSISALHKSGLETIKEEIYQTLDIIRVFTKPPKKEVDKSQPFILKKGSKVIDLAAHIHKDFLKNLKYVRLWRKGEIDGMRIDKNEILLDGDIVEFHTK